MPTLREVATRAGVSVATASRVLSGSAAVRPETRERVERAMRELLYVAPGRPTPTGAIGLLLPDLGNPIFPALAQEMEARASALGFATILCNTAASAERETEYVHMLLERRVDGMIFLSCQAADQESDHSHYARLARDGARLVFVNGGLPDLEAPTVGVDERAAGRLAAVHLLGLGHEQIAFVAGPRRYLPTVEKQAGIQEALRAIGRAAPVRAAYAPFGTEGGRSALRALLDDGAPPPTGVVCASDLMAVGVLQEAAARGLRVPEDVSVVGFDGIAAATWTRPALTTVEQPISDIAQTAVEALRTLIEEPGRALPHFVFRPRLRPRESTAAPG
jgi:DNA-binding LacI/PurR family transcriptional regulator